MRIQEYEKQVIAHLEDHGTTITNQDLTRAIQEAREFLEQLKPHLSKKEYQFLRETIESKAVPTPKLMIKDHQKKIPTTNQYPTRLVVPGQNFNAGFAKMGYLAIKRILERAGNDHTKCLIEQSYHLKRHLETLNLTATNSTLASIDATKYYTSIRYKLVKKAIEYFSRDLSPEDKATIEIGLSMIQKGMNSTYLSFKDRYYQYDGNHEDPDEKGLTIGGYESAWLSDVVGSYIFQQTQDLFQDLTLYHGTYRDDGISIFKNNLSYNEMKRWMSIFQERVNLLAEGDYLQYTCIIWKDKSILGEPPYTPPKGSIVTIRTDPTFPYLDMELYWNDDHQLESRVHLKENQHLLYLNSNSNHPAHCFKNIPNGVINRLAKLTTMNNDNMNTPMNELYPRHFQALHQANLLIDLTQPNQIPTLAEALQSIHEQEASTPISNHERRKKTRAQARTTYFCMGKVAGWKTPPWVTIQRAQKDYNLSWLRMSMSYHRFPNFKEILNADLVSKLRRNIISRDFQNEECNCKDRETTGCDYTDICRDKCLVYGVTCRITNSTYIGSTQQHFKRRMGQHFKSVRELLRTGKKSDSYAFHSARILQNFQKPSNGLQLNTITVQKLWQANPLTCVPTFGTARCHLCNHEKLAIFNLHRKDPHHLINYKSEITNKCRHKPQFHRFLQPRDHSTDEYSQGVEKVNNKKSNHRGSACRPCGERE